MKRTLAVLLLLTLTIFSTTAINAQDNTPKTQAAITIDFDGMEALFFGDNQASLGILNAEMHTPEMVINKLTNNGKVLVAKLTAQQLQGEIFFTANGQASPGNRYLSEDLNENDARWLIDFNQLYGRRFTIKNNFFSKIRFNTGLFYSKNLSEESVKFFDAKGSGKALSFNRKVGTPAAKIFLGSTDTLTITGANFEPIKLSGDGQYSISITNLPPPDHMSMDHFLNYYDIIQEPVEKYRPIFLIRSSFRPYPALCEPSIFSAEYLQ